MNKYGYLVYEDYPLGVQQSDFTIWANFATQEYSEDIILIDRFIPTGYQDWATFEPKKFDFNKFIFTGDPQGKVAYTSKYPADRLGEFPHADMYGLYTVQIDSAVPYSGSGIKLFTYNDWYRVQITIIDSDGSHTREFTKTEDEFYPIAYNGLQRVLIQFPQVQPYTFLKIVGFALGTIRLLTENDLIEEPEIVNHFSLTGEELEYNTLNLTVRGNKSDFNVITGERITYSRTGQVFYVDEAQYNNNGTITITAYDHIARLDKRFAGIIGQPYSKNLIKSLLGGVTKIDNDGDGTKAFADVEITQYDLSSSAKTSNIMQTTTCRDALRQVLLGNKGALKWLNSNKYAVINPNATYETEISFDEDTIVSVPQIDYEEKYRKFVFIKHTSDGNDEYSEVFKGSVPRNVQHTLNFDSVGNSLFYYVSGQTQEGEDILTLCNFDTSRIPYIQIVYRDVSRIIYVSTYTQPLVITFSAQGTINEEHESVDTSVAVQYKDNTLTVSDVEVCDRSSMTDILTYIKYINKFRKKITFDSIVEANAGDYIGVEFDDVETTGWIITKTERFNGVYTYEVACL